MCLLTECEKGAGQFRVKGSWWIRPCSLSKEVEFGPKPQAHKQPKQLQERVHLKASQC